MYTSLMGKSSYFTLVSVLSPFYTIYILYVLSFIWTSVCINMSAVSGIKNIIIIIILSI